MKKCTHLSDHPADDHHDLEDDDQEVESCHQIQPALGSMDDAPDFSALLVARSDVPVAA